MNDKSYKYQLYLKIISGVAFLLIAIIIVHGVYLRHQIMDSTQSWVLTLEQDEESDNLIQTLQENIGFGGFIHNFKNYVIRKDDAYYYVAEERYKIISDTLDKLSVFVTKNNITPEANKKLDIIKNVFGDYYDMLHKAKDLFEKNKMSTTDVDKIVKIDDTAVVRALKEFFDILQDYSNVLNKNNEKNFNFVRKLALFWYILIPFVCLGWFLLVKFLNSIILFNKELDNTHFQNLVFLRTFPDSILRFRISDGELVFANRLSRIMFGYNREEIKIRKMEQLLFKEYEGQIFPLNINSFPPVYDEKNEVRRPIDAIGIRRNKEVIAIEIHYSIQKEGQDEFLSLAVRDVTERKEAERKLKEISKAKSDFIANVSHEIRTPLNVILGTSQVLKENPHSDEEFAHFEMLEAASTALYSLVNDVLDYSKIEAKSIKLELKPVNIKELLSEIKTIFKQRLAEKENDLILKYDQNFSCVIISDLLRLRQILINLVGNSNKFTDNGQIEISVRSNDTNRIGNILFCVRDTGIGIPKDKLSDVFNLFTQVDASTTRKYGGTGLGLSIVKELVNLLKGEVWIESELGKGSEFYFTLQTEILSKDTVIDKGDAEKVTIHKFFDNAKGYKDDPDLIGKRILIADDSPPNRVLIKTFLKEFPFEFDEATDGIEALNKVVEAKEPYDLILMDMQMPNMDGIECTKKIRGWENIQNIEEKNIIISVTANAFEEHKKLAIEVGHNDYLAKPIKREKLIGIIVHYLKRKRAAA